MSSIDQESRHADNQQPPVDREREPEIAQDSSVSYQGGIGGGSPGGGRPGEGRDQIDLDPRRPR